ncbi:energy transducer TonB [Lysobacter pythonis]|uniref:Protein TonB n=1 Tax=Solilutibacter pythonis TaxID=2483112 RepID=A0A3M2HZ03_9GAMM|nr:energy transducer TonB [Lysobacter pythonis]RMH94971.1 energy transducer TonB [Lysobacter pythonis]
MNTAPPRAPARLIERRHLLWIALAALGIGLLLFMLIWRIDRGKNFYKADPNAAGQTQDGQVQVFDPLPAPLPARSGDGASQLPEAPAESAGQAARIIEPPPPAAAPASPPETSPATGPIAARGVDRAPEPVSQPAPRYPAAALRSGTGGLVRVNVDVGPDGMPTSVSIASGSGSRDLDRAALDAVRRWRFNPAIEDGQPSVGRVTVPIQFTP